VRLTLPDLWILARPGESLAPHPVELDLSIFRQPLLDRQRRVPGELIPEELGHPRLELERRSNTVSIDDPPG
jgi:hypothetical protein